MDIVAQVHPEGLQIATGEPPPLPVDFYDGFVLPQHNDSKPLQILYPETVQTNMHFLEEPHLYVVSDDGEPPYPTSLSVTGLAHKYEHHFEPDTAIAAMQNSRVFPKPPYAVNLVEIKDETEFEPGKGAILYSQAKDKVLANLPPNSTTRPGSDMYALLRSIVPNNEVEDTKYVYDRAMTPDEIKRKWELNGQFKRNRGNFIHHMAELALSGLPFHDKEPEMNIFYDFLRNYMIPAGGKIYCVEREILHKTADLAGSIDAVFKMPDGSFAVVDWKVSDKLKDRLNPSTAKYMKPPFTHLLNEDGCGYALQLSLYQKIFETQYNMKVSERILVSLSTVNPVVVSVPYLEPEVDFLLNTCIERTRARGEVEGFKCEITKKTLVDAVRTDDGRLVSERAAKMENLSYTPDQAVRDQVEKEVERFMKPVPFEIPRSRTWRNLYKAHNTDPFSGRVVS